MPSPSIVHFPDWETLPYDRFSPHPDIVSQRLAALHRMPALERGIVVVPVQTLLQRLAPLRHVVGRQLRPASSATGWTSTPRNAGSKAPVIATCRRCSIPGDFAVRGGLLDVYPMGAEQPYRIELLDDEIDTIRIFDPESQRSLDKIDADPSAAGARSCRSTRRR